MQAGDRFGIVPRPSGQSWETKFQKPNLCNVLALWREYKSAGIKEISGLDIRKSDIFSLCPQFFV